MGNANQAVSGGAETNHSQRRFDNPIDPGDCAEVESLKPDRPPGWQAHRIVYPIRAKDVLSVRPLTVEPRAGRVPKLNCRGTRPKTQFHHYGPQKNMKLRRETMTRNFGVPRQIN